MMLLDRAQLSSRAEFIMALVINKVSATLQKFLVDIILLQKHKKISELHSIVTNTIRSWAQRNKHVTPTKKQIN